MVEGWLANPAREVVPAGFADAWRRRACATIISVAEWLSE